MAKTTAALRQVVLAPKHPSVSIDVTVARYLATLVPAYALRSDRRCFSRWCRAHHRRAFPATPACLVAYLQAHSDCYTLATLNRRLATISPLHDALGAPNPRRRDCRDRALLLSARDSSIGFSLAGSFESRMDIPAATAGQLRRTRHG